MVRGSLLSRVLENRDQNRRSPQQRNETQYEISLLLSGISLWEFSSLPLVHGTDYILGLQIYKWKPSGHTLSTFQEVRV